MKQKSMPNILFFMLFITQVFVGYSAPLDTVHGNSATTAYYQTNVIAKYNPVLTMLDSLANQQIMSFENTTADRKVLNIYNFEENYIPRYTHDEYRAKLKQLNDKTPFDLVYNDEVRGFIDLYAVRRPYLTAKVLGLSELYFPLFEEYLDKYGLPLELKYLAVIESALNPKAVSPVGAAGLWQFMYNTGKNYGLKADSYVDDRYDPIKETDAACRYLKYLYSLFNDWSLVIAAYNTGEGNVLKAIRRAGGSFDFWQVMRYLPQETRSYVPAFIAVNYVMNNAAAHNIFPVAPSFKYWGVDTVKVSQQLRFIQISDVLKMKVEDIALLNPAYKKGIIPATIDKTYVLNLPRKYITTFVENESRLYKHKTQKEITEEYYASIHNFNVKGKETYLRHIVQDGESLLTIAQHYNCKTSDLVNWNRMKHQGVTPNQTILVKVDSTNLQRDTANYNRLVKLNEQKEPGAVTFIPVESEDKPAQTDVTKSYKTIKHKVKRGESMGLIATKYHISVTELKKLNKLHSSSIHPGQLLVVKKTVEYKKAPIETAVAKTSIKSTPIVNQTNTLVATTPAKHIVKSGESLTMVSQKYNCTVEDLKTWNKLKSTRLLSKQVLIVSNPQPIAETIDTTQKIIAETTKEQTTNDNQTSELTSHSTGKYVYHTVQRGDTIWSIAQRYKKLTPAEIKAINKINNPSDLKVGQKIKVGVSS